ncbi:unnamed protein product [Lampetra planeri]
MPPRRKLQPQSRPSAKRGRRGSAGRARAQELHGESGEDAGEEEAHNAAPETPFGPRETVLLKGAQVSGQLLICGATNWDLIGRKDVPKQHVAYKNLGVSLWGPHRYGCLAKVHVSSVVSGPTACHCLLLTDLGQVYTWGRGDKGQLGHGDLKRVEAPRPVDALFKFTVVAAACGRSHTLCITETGVVLAFGENHLGQLGLGTKSNAMPTPKQIVYSGQPVVKVACGAEFSMLVDCKGNLYSFGCPEYGQLGHNTDGRFLACANRLEFVCELAPRRVLVFTERTRDGKVNTVPAVCVADIACGSNHTLVRDSQRRVFSWGFGGYGRLGHSEQKDEMLPRLVKMFDFPGRGAASVHAGCSCSFAIIETGALYFWGTSSTMRESTMYPKPVMDLAGWKIRSLACGKSSVMVAADESTISWGPSPAFGELGYGDGKQKSSTIAKEVKPLDGIYIEQVAMGLSFTLMVARDKGEDDEQRILKLPEYNPRDL